MSQVESGSKIRVQYQGNFADRLVWNMPALMQFANMARLDTSVVIREGNLNRRNEVESMGDTLVWKAVKSPADLFARIPRSSAPVPFVEIFFSEQRESALQINHRIITDFVQEKSKGPFEEALFVASVDSSVKAGLGMLLALEKRNLTAYATATQALGVVTKSIELFGTGLEIGALGGFSYLSYVLAKGDFSNYLLQSGILTNFTDYFIVRVWEVGVAIFNTVGVIGLARDFHSINLARNYSFRSTESPFSHVKDFVNGHRFLTNSRLRTVLLSPDIVSDDVVNP